jgi:hypothetical protein
MGYSRHFLQAIEIPAVTQIRVSDDYRNHGTDPNQWKIGDSSLYAHALGMIYRKNAVIFES